MGPCMDVIELVNLFANDRVQELYLRASTTRSSQMALRIKILFPSYHFSRRAVVAIGACM
jgi:hypothetical protein